MENDTAVVLNRSHVVCQAVEGHLVLVHFESGLYYSITGTGADVCQLLFKGCSVTQIIDRLVRQYLVPQAQITGDVEGFVTRLLNEGLLVAAPNSLLATGTGEDLPLMATTYQSPRFDKFDDMADQLLLDRIEDQTRTDTAVRQAVVMAHCQ